MMEFGVAVKRIAAAFAHRANRSMEKHHLTVSQAEMIAYLNRRQRDGCPVIQRDIEEALNLSNPTVSGTLDRLEKKGMLVRVPNPENRRVNLVEITETARALTKDVIQDLRDLQEQMLSCLDAQERETLDRLLSKILDNLAE